jgi:RNA recognition motif-containing protein
MNIFVSNLAFTLQNEDLKALFAAYGEVSSAKIITDKITGKSRGFGFVEMPDDVAGNKAVDALNSETVEERTIKVSVAQPKERSTRSVVKSPFKNN